MVPRADDAILHLSFPPTPKEAGGLVEASAFVGSRSPWRPVDSLRSTGCMKQLLVATRKKLVQARSPVPG